MKHADDLLQHLDTGVLPEAQKTLTDARNAIDDLRKTLGTVDQTVGPQATNALNEVSKAAASLNGLADYLKRHPESLLKGKPEDPK